MDYGYQILRHVMQQVFGNLGAAARITLVLVLIPLTILLTTNYPLLNGQALDPETGAANLEIINGWGLFFGVIASIVSWFWAAVAWHRFVLLEEYPTGLFPHFHGTQIGNYVGNALLIGLILIGVALGIGLIFGILTALIQSNAMIFALSVGLIFGISWVATRIGLILPAAAIGASLRIGESWRATAPVSSQIMLPIIVIALVSGILTQGIIFAFGEVRVIEIADIAQQQVTLSLPGIVLNALVSWIQMLVNLALMTTLYGNLIEGRQLN